MHHGEVSPAIAKGLIELRKRIDKAAIPPSVLDVSLNIATWNIREFGKKARREDAVHYIAEILNEFDLIAITELRDNLGDLKRVLEILGPYWEVVFSDYIVDAQGNRERIGYLYDGRSVTFTGLAAEADAPRLRDKAKDTLAPQDDWWRKPYMASFRAGNFDFILLAAHIRWGKGAENRIPPLKRLAKWIDKRRKEEFATDTDFIVLGDFNIPSVGDNKLFQAITSTGLKMPPALRDVVQTNVAKSKKRYDQILHYPTDAKRFPEEKGKGGTLDFFAGGHAKLLPGLTKNKATFQLSDHLPLWVQIDTDIMDKRLQLLSKKKTRGSG